MATYPQRQSELAGTHQQVDGIVIGSLLVSEALREKHLTLDVGVSSLFQRAEDLKIKSPLIYSLPLLFSLDVLSENH